VHSRLVERAASLMAGGLHRKRSLKEIGPYLCAGRDRPGAAPVWGSTPLNRNSSAGRPPVAEDSRPVGSTRPVRSTPRRKFCL